jgi:hypothetical protein
MDGVSHGQATGASSTTARLRGPTGSPGANAKNSFGGMKNQNSGLGSMNRILRATNLLTTFRLLVREGMQRSGICSWAWFLTWSQAVRGCFIDFEGCPKASGNNGPPIPFVYKSARYRKRFSFSRKVLMMQVFGSVDWKVEILAAVSKLSKIPCRQIMKMKC